MGYSVLYIAFGIVALWLLGEVLLQYKARLRWRLLAFCGFLGVVVGVAAGQIAVMHRELVDERRWFGERRFLHALSYCTLLPGPEAQQLAIYLGWLLNGAVGGLIAGTLFVIPGYLALMSLSAIYAAWGETTAVTAIFAGLAPAVLAIVAQYGSPQVINTMTLVGGQQVNLEVRILEAQRDAGRQLGPQWGGSIGGVDVATPVPIYVTYLTVKPEGGQLALGADPYGLDGTAPSGLARLH